jgi:YVTN family beta-propeller protein
MKNLIKTIFLALLVVSCNKNASLPPSNVTIGGGVLIVNEGKFRAGNGSLSYYSYDSSKVYNDLFSSVNNRPLGDIPYSISTKGIKAYIVVNNSGKIEVVNQNSLVSETTITGLISPRIMAMINDNKAYVSSLYSDSLAIIDLMSNSISGYINLGRTSEAIALIGNKAYISNWSSGNQVMVVNTSTDKVIDSIKVGSEPESMVIDRYGRLWVLCDGGWMQQNFPELDLIDTNSDEVINTFLFPSKSESPSCLKIDGLGQTMYFLDNGVRQMDINAQYLPAGSFISESGGHFYKIAINAINSDIFISDAGDYVQPGYLILYKNTPEFVSKSRVGIIPGAMCFILKINTTTSDALISHTAN